MVLPSFYPDKYLRIATLELCFAQCASCIGRVAARFVPESPFKDVKLSLLPTPSVLGFQERSNPFVLLDPSRSRVRWQVELSTRWNSFFSSTTPQASRARFNRYSLPSAATYLGVQLRIFTIVRHNRTATKEYAVR